MAVTVRTPRRAGRRTNLALLLLLPAAFVTGWLAFGTGTPWPARVVTTVHAIVGIAALALVPWKQLIVRRGLARPSQPDASSGKSAAIKSAAIKPAAIRSASIKVASITLAVSVLLSLAAGFAHSYVGPRTYLGLTALQIHVGAAIVATPLFLVHLFSRPQRVRVTDASRRNLLRLGALLGVAAVGYAAVEGGAILARLPGRRRRSTGSYETGTDDPAAMPLTAWLFDRIPGIDPGTYQLTLRAAGNSRQVGFDDLWRGTDEVRAILDCTGGWYAAQTWRGVRLDHLMPEVTSGQVIEVISHTGYRRRFPGAEIGSLWLATHMAGIPLDPGHGGPARLVAPGRRGFWWVKWVVSIEVVTGADWWQPPFPLQ